MVKGLLPMKLLVYIVIFIIITFVLIMILNGIGLIAYNVTIPGMDNMKPMPGTTNSQLTISNVKLFSPTGEIPGEVIKGRSYFPFRIEFDAEMPEDADYTNGDSISFYFEGYKNGVDFSECRRTVQIMPGNIAHISSDNCLSLKPDWSGTVNIRIRARDSNGDAIASSYATFNSYMLMSSVESGSICSIINNVDDYALESVSIINDVGDQTLGKEIEDVVIASITISRATMLTVNGERCNGVSPIPILEAVGPFGKKCANIETYPSLLTNEEVTLRQNSKINIYRADAKCDCGFPDVDPMCNAVKVASSDTVTVISQN